MLLAVAVAVAGPAERVEGMPNWPELLPPRADVSGERVRLAFDVCPRRVVREMHERWLPLHRSCDHRAVFALIYMRTTEELVRTGDGGPRVHQRPALDQPRGHRVRRGAIVATSTVPAWGAVRDAHCRQH